MGVHPEGDTTCPQYINPLERKEEVSESSTTTGTGLPPEVSTKQPEPSETAQHLKEGTTYSQYISTSGLGERVSCPLHVVGSGPPLKLSTEQPKRLETPHLLTYKQLRKPSQTD